MDKLNVCCEMVTGVCLRFQNAAPASFSSAVPLMGPSRPHPGIASWLSSQFCMDCVQSCAPKMFAPPSCASVTSPFSWQPVFSSQHNVMSLPPMHCLASSMAMGGAGKVGWSKQGEHIKSCSMQKVNTCHVFEVK